MGQEPHCQPRNGDSVIIQVVHDELLPAVPASAAERSSPGSTGDEDRDAAIAPCRKPEHGTISGIGTLSRPLRGALTAAEFPLYFVYRSIGNV